MFHQSASNDWLCVDYSTCDENKRLHDQPHYTEPEFREAQTIFGKREDGLSYVYSDRLQQWDYEKARAAAEHADAEGCTRHTAKWYRIYLAEYFGKQIELPHIMAGHNLANGFPYQVFGYRELNS